MILHERPGASQTPAMTEHMEAIESLSRRDCGTAAGSRGDAGPGEDLGTRVPTKSRAPDPPVWHVITSFEAHDGAQRMLARLLNADADRREGQIISLLGVSEEALAILETRRIRVRCMEAGSAAGLAIAAIRLAGMIRRERPAVLVCWMYHAMFVGLAAAALSRTGVRVYWNVRQALDDRQALTASTRVAVRLCSAASPWANGIIYNSRRAAEQHAAAGFDRSRVTVIPNGVPVPSAAPAIGDPPRVFGIVGRLHPQKDHPTFFAAAAIVLRERPDARFVAVGRGLEPGAPHVAPLLSAAGLPADAVELVGEVSDIGRIYGKIDALVLSSRTEGFPNVVAEAMSHCRPVVSTDVGDVADIVGDTGFVVPPGRPELLAAAMLRMMSLTGAEYRSMAEAAHQRILGRYSVPEIVARYHAVLGVEDE